jgi:hypothetical protein
LFWPLFLWLAKPLRTAFPARRMKMRDLVQQVEQRNAGRLALEAKEDLWFAVQTIVCQSLSVAPEQVTKEARFVEDLNAG